MKLLHSLLHSFLAAFALSQTSRADLIEQFTAPPPRECTACVWFQALKPNGMTAADGHSGVLSLGSMPFGTNLYGGWLTFTPEGTFLTYIGAGSTHELLAPGGAALDDVRGALVLGEAYGVIVDGGTGELVAVTLYSGAVLWTPGHTYLLLVGGVPTIYEFTVEGAPIAGVRGGALLAGQVIDTDPGIGVSATLFSGAVVFTGSKAFELRTFGLGISATELLSSGAPIANIRGVAAMGGVASTFGLDAAAFLWTPSRTLVLTTAGGSAVAEVLDESGSSIPATWGVTRQSPPYTGVGFAATVITNTKEHFVFAMGGLTALEVLQPSGAPMRTDVVIPPAAPFLRQASGLSEVMAERVLSGGRFALLPVKGTVIRQ
jgi:hypothetical protein